MSKRFLNVAGLSFTLAVTALSSAEFPQAEISNGQLHAKLYLPDAVKGFYRATRFDWSGVIYSLVYQGHDYYTSWYQRVDPEVRDFVYDGDSVIAGPCSAMVGPAEEFLAALGYSEAKAGGTFIKMGIGILRKPDDSGYNRVRKYVVVDPGKWTIRKTVDSVEFIQQLNDPASGYGYVYRKAIRLASNKPEMVMEHSLKNTGRNPIHNEVYNHNFLRVDNQTTGPDFVVIVPFDVREGVAPIPQKQMDQRKPEHPGGPSTAGSYAIRTNQIVYLKPLEGQDHTGFPLLGFGNSAKDHDIRIESKKLGVGVRIVGDQPLLRETLWSIRSTLVMEPYVEVSVEPGKEFAWTNTYTYYTPGK